MCNGIMRCIHLGRTKYDVRGLVWSLYFSDLIVLCVSYAYNFYDLFLFMYFLFILFKINHLLWQYTSFKQPAVSASPTLHLQLGSKRRTEWEKEKETEREAKRHSTSCGAPNHASFLYFVICGAPLMNRNGIIVKYSNVFYLFITFDAPLI